MTDRWESPIRQIFDRRVWRRVAYLLATLPVGIFWFAVTITLITAGLPLVIVWIGLPILWAAFLMWRRGARLERRFIEWGLDLSIADPYCPEPNGTLRRRWLARLGDQATWRDLAYLILLLPLGILWFTLVVITLALPLGLLATPFTYSLFPDGQYSFVSTGWEWLIIDSLPNALVAAGLGLILLPVVPLVVRGLAAIQGEVAVGLLGPTRSAMLTAQVRDLEISREHGLDAAEFERQRIERNLHDGAQPRLVALAMELGMAKEKLATDPEAAAELVDRAHGHAKQAIEELRDLARGIHPAVLTDRGLDAALSALAGRSPVPVDVDVHLHDRLPPSIESAAYFVAAEGLTNAAKHAAASRVAVTVEQNDDLVTVEVRDDGRGGADPQGAGLRGLADRVGAVGGRLIIDSRPGGPTAIRAELPCES
jgi:signal transduction histidine kinase